MGGIGKTTLSKKIYHLFHEQYDKSSFLEDVKSKNIEDLKKQLLQDLCGRKKNSVEFVNGDDLKCIEETMISKKVLVVIDDVAEKLINDLSKVLAFQGKNRKSNVIMTCRNWGILEGHLDPNGRFEVPYLNKNQAMELFLSHAFHNTKQVEKGFEKIVEEIVEECAGLPLSLEVMGGFLHKKKNWDMQTRLKIWMGALKKLQAGNNLDGGIEDILWKSLEISYKDLDQPEKDMFLDIACYFSGLKEIIALRIWDSESSTLELQNLKDRSLIKVNKDGNLIMHDQLRDMGQKFAIRLKELPTFIDKLIALQSLNLSRSSQLKELPPSIDKLTTLQSLDLSRCLQLKELPTSINKLIALQSLHLARCSKLKELPTSIDNLTTLRWLDLSGCLELKELPTSIDKLTALRWLDLSKCSKLKELPTSIDKLTSLEKLDLSGCSNLTELPISINKLISLENLDLSKCLNLMELPTSIDKLTSLEKLDLSG
ncbi:unnamed protein product, partial [Sphagnum troendelagicum]